ncbi:MAG: hypothetical protein AAF726_02350 [Planctomycetota bacterium]
MIGLLLAGSLVLGWQAMKQQRVIDEYEAALRPGGEVEKLAEGILKRAYQYTEYKERSANEGVKGDRADSVSTYVFELAARPRVQWGNLDIAKPRTTPAIDGFEDTNYRITPKDKNAQFERAKIANFLYLLEEESRKLKITEIDLRIADRKVKDHEVPADRWSVDLTVTVRDRK